MSTWAGRGSILLRLLADGHSSRQHVPTGFDAVMVSLRASRHCLCTRGVSLS